MNGAVPTLRSGEAWPALERHYAQVGETHLRDLFAADPDTFAQAVGLAFTAIALAGAPLSTGAVTLVAVAAALAAAFLNAAFGICLGCEVYLLARRATSHDIVRTVPNDRTAHPRTEVPA